VSSRPGWDETWLDVATDVARRSLCTRDRVGAVIVTERNRIVATGYNGPPRAFRHDEQPCVDWCPRARQALANRQVDDLHVGVFTTPLSPSYDDCPSLHAEANALSVCDRSAREGGTIYVTSHTCSACAKLVANSGLRRIVVLHRPGFAHRNPVEHYEFLVRCMITVTIYDEYNRILTRDTFEPQDD